jgi:hypothetical protein
MNLWLSSNLGDVLVSIGKYKRFISRAEESRIDLFHSRSTTHGSAKLLATNFASWAVLAASHPDANWLTLA